MSAQATMATRSTKVQSKPHQNPKGKKPQQLNSKPLTVKEEVALIEKTTLIDEKGKEVFLGTLKDTYEKQLGVLKFFADKAKVLKGTPYEHLILDTEVTLQTLNLLVSSALGSTEARAVEQKTEEKIARLILDRIGGRKLHELESAEQDALQQDLRAITPIPSLVELQFRFADLKDLTDRLRVFNAKILENQLLINKEEKSLNASSISNVRFDKVAPLVATLKANREELSKEAENLKKYAVEAFKRLVALNAECATHYPVLAPTDLQFVRSAGVHMQTIEKEAEIYKSIYDLTQSLKKRETKMESIWDEFCKNANRMSTDTRYLIHLDKEKKIPGIADYVVALGRPWVGPDKYVDSFAFGKLRQSTGIMRWIFGSGTPAPAAPATSTEPV